MRVIPAISISREGVLVVEDGQYELFEDDAGPVDPVKLVKGLREEHQAIFVLDIDGIERNSPDLDTIKRMAGFAELWVDAGSMTCGGAADMLITGAAKVVMGTKSLLGLGELADAVELSENIIFSLDWDNGLVATEPSVGKMSPGELLKIVPESGVETAMLFDLGGARDRRPPDLELVRLLVGTFPELYVAGSVGPDDRARLENVGVAGAIIDFRSVG